MSSDSDQSDVGSASPVAVARKKTVSDDSDSDSPRRSPQNRAALDSDSDTEQVSKKRGGGRLLDSDESDQDEAPTNRPVIASDDDDEERSEGKKVNTSDIFGQEVSSSDEDEAPTSSNVRRDSGSDDSIHGIRMHNPEDDEEMEEEVEEEDKDLLIKATIEECYIRPKLGDGPHFVKTPNFLSVQVHPFDEDQYEEDELDDQLKVDEEGNQRLKLRVENTLRWRNVRNSDGTETRESNAKFVKWSDGTMSMYLGNEIFEVTIMPVHVNHQSHLYTTQSGSMSAQAIIENVVKFRPHSTDSKTHRKVTLNMADRSRKSAQVKVMDELRANPDIARRAAAKKEEDEIRAAMRRSTQMRKAYRPAKYSRGGGGGGYDDDDNDEPRRRKEAPIIGLSDDEEEDNGRKSRNDDSSDSDEDNRKKKQHQKKRIDTSDEDSD